MLPWHSGFPSTTPWAQLIHTLPYPEKPLIVPAGRKPNNLTSTCCIISAQLTHLSGAVLHPSTGVKWQGHPEEWSKFLALDETAHNSSEMHVLGLVFQVMCVHGEEEEKWARAILPVLVQSFRTWKAFIENLFCDGSTSEKRGQRYQRSSESY